MNILSIDTLSPIVTVAAQGSKGLAVRSFAGNGRSHAEQLIPMMDSVVDEAGFTSAETDLVITPEGPGSFTGLRLAYAAAKALQLTSSATFIPVPTLPCIAYQYKTWSGNIAAVIDAKRNRFYTQLFTDGKPLTDSLDVPAEELLPFFTKKEPWLIAGYGSQLFYRKITDLTHSTSVFFIETPSISFAQTMIEYAQNECEGKASADPYASPVYIRKSDAEKG